MNAASLLLTQDDVRFALGSAIGITAAAGNWATQPLGEVLRAAAVDSAFTRYTGGAVVNGEDRPVAVGSMVLVFDGPETAARLFDQVGQAAHLRAEVEHVPVAVETVTAPSGLVSYWGFAHQGQVILIVTLDTLDPQEVSMSEFRSLVMRAVERMDGALR